ncbi:MAG: delta-60 repeat domain-containing protein [Ferruginibacter sp.]|nr:delta-60 repeat domain-containing protein [Ferruginibacter sp.]
MNTKFPPNRVLLFLLCISLNIFKVDAQPGQFDSSFNGNGRAFTGTPDDQLFAHTSILQPDGKLIVAGESYTSFEHACLVRYNLNGSLDEGFGTGGNVKTDFLNEVDRFYALAVLKNGKIIAGDTNGWSGAPQHGILALYHPNGKPDSSFGVFGKLILDFGAGPLGSATISDVEELPNGNSKVIGSTRLATSLYPKKIIAQLKPTGLIDSMFGINGIADMVYDSRGLRAGVQHDGKVIFTNTRNLDGVNHFEVSRYLFNGEQDLTFNNKRICQHGCFQPRRNSPWGCGSSQ